MRANLRFHLRAALKALAFLFALPVFWYSTIFFGSRLPEIHGIGVMFSVMLAVCAATVIYLAALAVLTRILLGKVDLD